MNLHLDAGATGSAISFVTQIYCSVRNPSYPTAHRPIEVADRNQSPVFTAEILYDEASKARCHISRATVCSALRQFEQVGLAKRNQRTKITESLVCPRPKL